MRGMQSAVDFVQAPPPGRYPITLDAAEAGTSAKGESHLKISFSVSDGPYKGASGFHYIGTDGGTKYGAMGKKHLRALGVPVDSDAEIPDSVIAAKLTGLRLLAECGNEPRQKPVAEGSKEMITVMEFDAKQNKQVAIMNLSLLGYVREPGARIDLGLPGAPAGAPQNVGGYAMPLQVQGYPTQQGAPSGYPQGGPPPGFAPQGQAQYQQPQAQFAPPQFAPPQPGFVPGQAVMPWNGQAAGVGAQPGVPQMPAGASGVRPG